MKITVLGSGAWGTALSMVLLENGHDVSLWSYFEHETTKMKEDGENPFLKGVKLPSSLILTSDINAVKDCDAVVVATPSFAIRETATRIKPLISKNAVLICVSKGIERETSLCLTQVIEEVIEKKNPVVALSGPSHAEEVSRNIPTAVVAACEDMAVAEWVQDLFMNERFRVYASHDIIGVELGAALKNVIALCAGCCDGMGYGDNTKAMLMTRGLAEIARVGKVMGGSSETFAGLAGMGDLIVTCTSMHSRNRRAGLLIGAGKSPQDAVKEIGAVVEGYYAAESGFAMAQKYGVEMPITEATYNILYHGGDIHETVRKLMTRAKRHEHEEAWV